MLTTLLTAIRRLCAPIILADAPRDEFAEQPGISYECTER